MFFYTCGPHTALIKSSNSVKTLTQIVIGGRLFALPIFERVDTLDLRLRTLSIQTNQGITLSGVPVSLTATIQAKIQGWTSHPDNPNQIVLDDASIRLAAQHFLGQKETQINSAIKLTVAGHQRSIVGSLTVEQLYRDPALLSKRVVDLCKADLRGMGVAVVSYTVAEISDDSDYIHSLGVTQTEKVKRQAVEGASLHISKATAWKTEMDTKAHMKENLEKERTIESDKKMKMVRSDSRKDILCARAVQKKAGVIKTAEMMKVLMVARKQAEAKYVEMERVVDAIKVEKEKLIKLAQIGIAADAELYRKQKNAEMVSVRAEVEGWRIRKVGEAEGHVIRAKGEAEADILEQRVKVWMENTSAAAILDRLVDILPQVAREIARPLEQTSKLVFIGNGARRCEGTVHEHRPARASDERQQWGEDVNMNCTIGAFLEGDPDSDDWKKQVAQTLAQ